MTQNERVLRHLKDYKSITSWEAITEYGITRISSVIHRLRKNGFKISTEYKTKQNRYGDKVNYGVYKLED